MTGEAGPDAGSNPAAAKKETEVQTFEVVVEASVYVSVEQGGESAAVGLARRFVAQDWLTRSVETYGREYGRAVVKGLSGAVVRVEAFRENGRVVATPKRNEAPVDDPDIF